LTLAPEKTARPAPALQTVGRPNTTPETENRIDPNSTDFKSSSSASQVQPDILGGTHIGDLMAVLISGRQNERESLAFTLAPEAKDPEKGFLFRFYRGKDSVGYYTNLFGGDDVTVANIYLDVKPVRMNLPFHKPAQ
jgi:cyanophycinase